MIPGVESIWTNVHTGEEAVVKDVEHPCPDSQPNLAVIVYQVGDGVQHRCNAKDWYIHWK